jgi:putative membrane protein
MSDEPAPIRASETADATRRTWLALERTQLAWWRTGLTALAVGIGVGRVVPELQEGSDDWPYVALGLGFALYGIALIALGTVRERQLSAELAAGRTRLATTHFDLALAIAGMALGVATGLLILLG